MGVSKNTPWFNHTTIQEALSSVGIVYTMADKDAESIPYININDVSFLKRIWRYDVDIGTFVAKLDHESIEKSLMIWVRSKTISSQMQSVAIMSSAIREYFWYGKDIFGEKRIMFLKLIKDLELENWVDISTLPSWDQLYKEFWSV
jgi:hypothetical protein